MDEQSFTVLSVSDDHFLLATRERVLRTIGVRVISCPSRDAGERLKSERFDLVVLGHSLKHETGSSLAAQARVHSPGVRVVVLSRTAYHLNDSDFADVVCVPDPPVMLAEVQRLLGIAGEAPARSDLGRESL